VSISVYNCTVIGVGGAALERNLVRHLRAILGRNFKLTIEKAAWEACSATWNLGTNSAFALEPGKPRKTLIELAGRRTFRMQTDF
jgi:hypothetical protein